MQWLLVGPAPQGLAADTQGTPGGRPARRSRVRRGQRWLPEMRALPAIYAQEARRRRGAPGYGRMINNVDDRLDYEDGTVNGDYVNFGRD